MSLDEVQSVLDAARAALPDAVDRRGRWQLWTLIGLAGEGEVALRCLRPGEGDDVGTGVGCAAAAVYLLGQGVRAAGDRAERSEMS